MYDNNFLKLKTGNMSVKEIELILDTLPIDITFIGSNDEVRYFNKLESRTFKRSVSVIGLKVQNCHPKKSLDRVQQILEANGLIVPDLFCTLNHCYPGRTTIK